MIFNLSLDDMSPHPHAGLGFESIGWCDKLIEQWPDIKINLFVPAAYKRLGEKAYPLSECPAWIKKTKALPSNYSIGLHGYTHCRINDPKHVSSNNDEFQFLDETRTELTINKMISEFDRAGLKYNKIFRPPGWKISRSACKTLSKMGFVIAGDEDYRNRYKNISGLRWISYNYDLNGPCNITGDIMAYGHTSDWTSNYMNKKAYEYIVNILNQNDYDFKFLEEMV